MPGYLPKPFDPIINRDHSISNQLFAAWPMHENDPLKIYDVGGREFNCTQTNAPTVVNTEFGRSKSFNVTKNYKLTAGKISFGDNTNDEPYTILVVVKFAGLAGGGGHLVCRDQGKREWTFLNIGTQLGMYMWDYADVTGLNYIGRLTPASSLATGNWYTLVATYNANKAASGIKIYINGIRKDNANSNLGTYTASGYRSDVDLTVGGRGSDTLGTNGNIANVVIWKRELDQSEVNLLHYDPFLMYRGRKETDWMAHLPISGNLLRVRDLSGIDGRYYGSRMVGGMG